MIHSRFRMMTGVLLVAALILAACGSGDTGDDQADDRAYTIGIVLTNTLQYVMANSFRIELEALGYVEGETIDYISILVESPDDLGDSLDQLIASDVDVIFTPGAAEATVALEKTGDIPIVFASGFAEVVNPLYSQQRAGALITGITLGDATTRRLDFLLRLDESIERVYAPYDPNNDLSAVGFALITALSPIYDVEIIGYQTPDLAANLQAIEDMPDDIDAIFLWLETYAVQSFQQWADAALARDIPATLPIADIELLDFTMGFGPKLEVAGQQSAHIVDRVLQGTPANQILIESSDPVLAVNLVIADQIGLNVPDEVLGLARVIVRGDLEDVAVVPELAETGGACNTTLESPLGIVAACVTVGCEGLVDTAIIVFVDKVPVEACAQAGVVGSCSTAGSTTYFYEGDRAVLQQGCTINNGAWGDPEGAESGAAPSG